MIRKILFLTFLMFFTCQSFYSQVTYEGQVRDSLQNPISFANVIVRNYNSDEIVSYSSSDSKGFFLVKINEAGTYRININALSYVAISKVLKVEKIDLENSKSFENVITLKKDIEKLNEIVVNAEKAINVKNDTVDIKVQSFLSGTEDVAEDVLKKLPGIEVDSDGNIRVQGKSVKKVLIEGDDLFENGYKLLTKNLDAGTIDKVQVLNNFSINPILKGIEDSDDVALNISLKDEVKNTLFGKTSLGAGVESVYEAKANIINIRKKTKVYFFGNLNNIGADPTGDIYQLIYPNYLSGENFIGDGESSNSYFNKNVNEPPLQDERYNFNNAKLASLNAVFNPSDKLKIKTLLFFTKDKNQIWQKEIEEFEVDSLRFRNVEESNFIRESSIGSSRIHLTYKPNKNKQLEFVSKFNIGEFRNNNNFNFNNSSNNVDVNESTYLLDNRLTYTYKIDSLSALQATTRYIRDRKPANFNFSGYLYDNIFPGLSEAESSWQDLESSLDFFGLEISYFKNLKNGSPLRFDLGYKKRSSVLDNQLYFLKDNGEKIYAPNEYQNDSDNNFQRWYANFNLKQNINKFSIRTGLRFYHTSNLYQNFSLSESNSGFNIIPNLEIALEINNKNKILTSYQYSLRDTKLSDLYQNYILRDYREFRRGLGSFKQFRGHNLLFSYIHGDWSDSFLVNTSILYSSDLNYLGYSSRVNPNNSSVSSVIFDDKEFYSFNLNIDQYLKSIFLNLKLNSSISHSSFENIVNSKSRNISSYTYKFGPEVRSVFLSSFNFHTGIDWTISKFKTSETSLNISSLSFVDLNYNPTEKLIIELSNELYSFEDIEPKNNFIFSDLMLKYMYSESLTLHLNFKNIWNTDSFETLSLSDTGRYLNNYRILPRFALLTVDIRF